jgi:Fe-S-cluster containining protein
VTLENKVKAVEQVFANLDAEIADFQSWSGLGCPAGCGKCCFKPDIEATILEFLPFALFLHQEKQAFQWLEKMESGDLSICKILNPLQTGQGLCSEYKHRGLICRLFGYSARLNKYGKPEMVTCSIIKAEDPYESAVARIESGEKGIPVMSQYYMQLHAIDIELTKEFYPINEAIKRAIETVLHYFAYRSES